MMAHNLCYTTLLDVETINRLGLVKGVDYTQTPNNGGFFLLFYFRCRVLSLTSC